MKLLPIVTIITGLIIILFGALISLSNIYGTGKHYLTQQHMIYGGGYLIVLGSVLLISGYFSLSPFSKIREFFEGREIFKNRFGKASDTPENKQKNPD